MIWLFSLKLLKSTKMLLINDVFSSQDKTTLSIKEIKIKSAINNLNLKCTLFAKN